MMKKGFTLIEVIIATALASVLSVLLLRMVTQLNTTRRRLDDRTGVYTRMNVVNQQLVRDLMGVFWFTELEPSKEQEPGAPQPEEGAKQATKKEQPKPRFPTKLFFAKNKDKLLSELLFISTNPAQSYWGPKAGGPRPRAARIRYQLVPEKDKPQSYQLLREEFDVSRSGDYSVTSGSGARQYEIARGIKSLVIRYGWIEYDTTEVGDSRGKQRFRVLQYHREPEWESPERTPDPQKDKYNPRPVVPDFFEVALTLWDADQRREYPFTFPIIRAGFFNGGTMSEKEEKRVREASGQGKRPAGMPEKQLDDSARTDVADQAQRVQERLERAAHAPPDELEQLLRKFGGLDE